MLRLVPAHPVDTLWDALLPLEVRRLNADLAQLDTLLEEETLLEGFKRHWEQAAQQAGRPTIPMATYLRLMVVQASHGVGLRETDPGGLRLSLPAAVLLASPASGDAR